MRRLSTIIGLLLILSMGARPAEAASGATLYLAPAAGNFTVGNTFTASVFVNTGGNSINAVEVDLKFPQDRLQVVNPAAGPSIIGVWAAQPAFSNSEGTINLKGGIPSPGISTTAGLVTTITFRVVGVGRAALRFTGASKILLNDGQGTPVLSDTRGAIYDLALPAPEGPFVSTPSHPDPEKWYQDRNPTFLWEKQPDITAFSYVLNDRPIDTSDDIPEGDQTRAQYSGIGDGVWFFHIKARGPSGWGGTTHVQIKIDGTPPASFPIEITPRPRTTNQQPTIYYQTSDNLSGLSHYEIKVVPLDAKSRTQGLTPFFINTDSPYRPPPLSLGAYDVIVRAYDVAGNIHESHEKLSIVPFFYQVLGKEGIAFSGRFTLAWPIVWTAFAFIILLLLLIFYYLYRRHRHHDEALSRGVAHADHPIAEDLKLLAEKQKEYGGKR